MYPFGMTIKDRSWFDANGDYRYGFQGQEEDKETGLVSYKFRMHDPRTGRFFAIDPLASKYPHNSPFAFSENVVINAVELEGLEKKVIFDNSGAPGGDVKEVEDKTGIASLFDDKYFGGILESLKTENLINDLSEVTFTWTGHKQETKNSGPWYWRSVTTDLTLEYNISFSIDGADVIVPIEIGLGGIVYHPGGNVGDYALALIGTGAYAQVFKNQVVNNAKRQVVNHFTKILESSGVKFSKEQIVQIGRDIGGKIIFLEKGNAKAGLEHILTHTDDFITNGIAKGDISDYVFNAVKNGKIVGYQGKGVGRPIYETLYKGQARRVAVTTSDNGFIVGANPVSIK